MNNQSGIALPVVLAFALIAAGLLASILFTSTQTAGQNKIALYQLQSHYLALSAIQHMRLKIQHLSYDITEMLESSLENPFSAGRPNPGFETVLNSERRSITNLKLDYNPNYSLFSSSAPPDNQSPIYGFYQFVSMEREAEARAVVLNSYVATCTAGVTCGCSPTCANCLSYPNSTPYVTTISERLVVARDY